MTIRKIDIRHFLLPFVIPSEVARQAVALCEGWRNF
jgi:hypothetical protein